jgi:hypothetical protein
LVFRRPLCGIDSSTSEQIQNKGINSVHLYVSKEKSVLSLL